LTVDVKSESGVGKTSYSAVLETFRPTWRGMRCTLCRLV